MTDVDAAVDLWLWRMAIGALAVFAVLYVVVVGR